ncbi:MAG: chemotaxis protein CheC [Candidatus Anammoxibacter sp.]
MKLASNHVNRLTVIVDMCVDAASRTLSKSLRTAAIIKVTNTAVRDVCEVTEKLNEDEREMVASLLLLNGTGNGKVLFMVEKKDAYILKDLYLNNPVGTTKEYDACVESVIQEIGNILSGAISNSLAADLGLTILPTPPLVTCDFAGTIFSAMVMDDMMDGDEILLMDTLFEIMHYNLNCHIYLIPGTTIIEKLDQEHLI